MYTKMQIEENEYILNYLTETFGIIRNYIEQQSEENKTLKNIINNTNKEVLKRVSPLGLVSASDAFAVTNFSFNFIFVSSLF